MSNSFDMIEGLQLRHSILVVTFNQQEYIGATLTSLVSQSELPYEIVVLDDCSTDGNWVIISEYAENYPDLIKAYRNDVNLGLQKNLQKIKHLYTGNVVSYCSGDDLLEKDAVRAINSSFQSMGIDPGVVPALVVTNSLHLYPDGNITLWDNYIERDISLIKSRLRYSLSYRSIGFSRALNLLVPCELEIASSAPEVGLSADFIKGFEEVILAKHVRFLNYPGAVYRLSVGVTSKDKTNAKWIVHQNAYKLVCERYSKYFDSSDLRFIKFVVSADQLKISPGFIAYFTALYYYIINIGNFGYNNPMIRNLHYFVPGSIVDVLKSKVYPLFLKFRQLV